MAHYRHWSDEQKAAALAAVDAAGADESLAVTRVSRNMKIPRSTLRVWVADRDRAAPAHLRQEKKLDLTQAIRDEIEAVLKAMGTTRADADYRALTIALGILVDKMQLLTNKPTEISEVRDWRTIMQDEGIDPADVLAEAERIIAGG